MKFIRNYQIFLESLLPSQVRRYMKVFNRERYSEIFNKFEGDKNHYRIFIPLVAKPTIEKDEDVDDVDDDSTESRINNFLEENDYSVIDYIKGVCKFNNAKNPSKIGQVLTRLEKSKPEAKELMKLFVEDPTRKAGAVEDLVAVISRHPFDIAGADTDRAWTNCMTMAHAGSPKVKELQDKLAKLVEKKKRISIESSNLELMVDEIENAEENENEEELMKDLGYSEDEVQKMKDKVRELEREESDIDNKIEDLEENIDDRLSTGENAKYLIYDVKEGSLISFLVKKSDKNIKNPLATLNIKPYINEDNENDFILVADTNMYGQTVPEFKQTIDAWLKQVNGPDKEGIFCLNPKLYDDSGLTIELLSKKSAIARILERGSLDDLREALTKNQVEISDIRDIIYKLQTSGRYNDDVDQFNSDIFNFYKNINNMGRYGRGVSLSTAQLEDVKKILKEFIPQDLFDAQAAQIEFSRIHCDSDGVGLIKLLKNNPEYIKYLTYGGIFKPKKDPNDRYNDNIIDAPKIFDDTYMQEWNCDNDYAFIAHHDIFDDEDGNFSDSCFFVELNKDDAEKLKEMGLRFFTKQAKISKKPRIKKAEVSPTASKVKKAKKIKESIRTFRDFRNFN